VTFEAIMAPNIAIIIEAETDNKTRTLSDLKLVLKKAGGISSSSAFYFTRRGRVVWKPGKSPGPTLSDMVDESIEHEGVEDIDEHPDGESFVAWTEPSHLSAVTRSFADKFGLDVVESDIIQAPNPDTVVPIDSPSSADALGALLASFAEYTEVKAIYVNVRQGSVSDDDWEKVERHIDV
jgi:transcriptional/translational regulatory protein YebC/TACO1